MARLIDADALLESEIRRCGRVPTIGTGYINEKNFESVLEETTTVDAVPVVRCRDCQHWKPTGNKAGNSFSDMEYIGGCEFTNYCRRESDFCSCGERKDGGHDG